MGVGVDIATNEQSFIKLVATLNGRKYGKGKDRPTTGHEYPEGE